MSFRFALNSLAFGLGMIPAVGPTPFCLDFCDPARTPELFDPANRKDHTHLNEAGAQEMTKLLVKALTTRRFSTAAGSRDR
jgi:hypothetical protein